jgi:lipoate-protein ligase A
LSYERSTALTEIRASYHYILERVGRALGGAAAGIEQEGISDLAIAGRKFSGNAQQRKRHHLLHHGTLLYAFDLARVGRYLRPPPRQPEYRAGREHTAFLRNLALSAEELLRRLRAVWQADVEGSAWQEERVRQLVGEKYSSPDWTRRR